MLRGVAWARCGSFHSAWAVFTARVLWACGALRFGVCLSPPCLPSLRPTSSDSADTSAFGRPLHYAPHKPKVRCVLPSVARSRILTPTPCGVSEPKVKMAAWAVFTARVLWACGALRFGVCLSPPCLPSLRPTSSDSADTSAFGRPLHYAPHKPKVRCVLPSVARSRHFYLLTFWGLSAPIPPSVLTMV